MIREWNEESLDHRNALLYAMGRSEEEVKRPVIGLLNSWNEMNPGHFQLRDVVEQMKRVIYEAGALALELPVTGICDGIDSSFCEHPHIRERHMIITMGNAYK